jgi:hypothetical protein
MASSPSEPEPQAEKREKKGGKKKWGTGPSWMSSTDSVVEPNAKAGQDNGNEELPDWLKQKNAEAAAADDDDDDDLTGSGVGSRVGIAISERSGYLQKKNKRGRWQKRYFKIEGGALVYYTDERAKKKKGSFMISDFDNMSRTGSELKLSAEGSNKKHSYVYELKADNDEEASEWIQALRSNHAGMGKSARSACFWIKKRFAKFMRYLLVIILVIGSLTDMSLALSQGSCPKGQKLKQWVMLATTAISVLMAYDVYSHKGRFLFTRVWIAVCAVAMLASSILLIEGAVNVKESKHCKVPVKFVEGLDACLACAWLVLGLMMWKQPSERRFNKL